MAALSETGSSGGDFSASRPGAVEPLARLGANREQFLTGCPARRLSTVCD